jgi:hypothetical protein
MGEFGLPRDGVAWTVLCIAVLLGLLALRPTWLRALRDYSERHYRLSLLLLSLGAALLSLGYVEHYLRGGPRIIDATAYLLEARTFASGHLTLPGFEPSAALRGRFLYFEPDLRHLSVLFPPGYPAVLALGVLAGYPLLIGPALAALLVWSTAELARRLFDDRGAALLAATLSMSNACLRYHTAEPMSHGLSALLVCLALYGALGKRPRDTLLSGLSLGWLVATRPVTAMAIGLVLGAHWLVSRRQPKDAIVLALGLLPGAALWLGYQWATTGSPWSTTQYAYYSVADGPPGCFRYGFGAGIGCLFEHGTYVGKRLPEGYGLFQALYVTLLRLRWHSLDVLNFELLVPVLLFGLWQGLRHPRARWLGYASLLVVAAYLPFYFDASYPGGGARLFADVLPLEHVLVGAAAAQLLMARWLLPVSLAGFALHGAFEHRQLMQRDGGRPMFEASVLEAQHVRRGLVFIDTDHGFLLGHTPANHDPARAPVVARHHGDSHDRLLWERLGRPPTYHYRFDPSQREASAHVALISPEQLRSYEWFEAEAEWPPIEVRKGWVLPVYPPNDCTSQLRGLSLEPTSGRSQMTLELPVAASGVYRLQLAWVARQTGRQQATLELGGQRRVVDRDAQNHQCFETVHPGIQLESGPQRLSIEAGPLGLVLDRYRLESEP